MAIHIGTRVLYGPSGTEPTSPTEGSEWWDSTTNVLNVYNGTTWRTISTSAQPNNFAALDTTFMYFDFGDYAGSSWQGNTSATTLTNIESGASTQGLNLPRGNATYNAANGGILRGASTENVRNTFSATNPHGSDGMSMGVVVRFDSGSDNSTTARGIIYYGNTSSDDHLYVRKNFGAANSITVGEDTNGSDTWTTAFSGLTSSDGFMVLIFNHASDGTLSVSRNGGAFTTIRTGGTYISVTNPTIGLFGDTYNDNESSFDIGAAYWRSAVTTDLEAAGWFSYLKTDYGAGENRFAL
jgi:hypothetical protein